MFGIIPRVQAAVAARTPEGPLRGFIEHPVGPFTIHFWAPTAKWLISAANIADLGRPVEKMSVNQQAGACLAVVVASFFVLVPPPINTNCSPSPPTLAGISVTGVIWARYSTQITPVNYNLLAVNAVMAMTGIWHLGRILSHQQKKSSA
jgi:hypothetical protein